jgi:hypothetical protein
MSLTVDRLKETVHYDPDTGIFTWLVSKRGRFARIGQVAGKLNKGNGYVLLAVDGKTYRAHRLAWLYMYEKWPTKKLDHKDNIRHHNWLTNLREATDSENLWNQGKLARNKSGFKGVYFHSHTKQWMARCSLKGVRHYLGLFSSPDLASAAYQVFAEANHGEFFHTGTI